MHPNTRTAVIARFAAIAGADAIVPTSWEQIGNLGLKLQIEAQDPELAQVLKNQMPAALELDVLQGNWSIDAPAERDLRAEKAAAINAALANLPPVKSMAEMEAERDARLAQQEADRRNSFVLAHGSYQ